MTRRFAVQRHTTGPGRAHYDLMIEDGEVLVTCRLGAPPDPAGGVRGVRTPDHRRRYLDYEGDIGGGRGRVDLHDRGQVTDLRGTPRARRYLGRFAGERLVGRYELREEAPSGAEVEVRFAPAEDP